MLFPSPTWPGVLHCCRFDASMSKGCAVKLHVSKMHMKNLNNVRRYTVAGIWLELEMERTGSHMVLPTLNVEKVSEEKCKCLPTDTLREIAPPYVLSFVGKCIYQLQYL